MSFHSNQTANHVIQNYTFADEAARLSSTGFVSGDVGKVSFQTDNLTFWVLTAITPTWSEVSSLTTGSTFIGLIDTFSNYVGNAGLSLQVNSAEDAIEIGQDLRATSSPSFSNITLSGAGITTIIPLTIIKDDSGGDDDDHTIVYDNVAATNGVSLKRFQGDRDPNGNITGAGGDEYSRKDAALSKTYESREATTGPVWLDRSVNGVTTFEIHSNAEWEALASGGTITITGDTTIKVLSNISTTTEINVTGGDFMITGDYNEDATIVYTGAGTFITAVAGSDVRLRGRVRLEGADTGTLFNVVGAGSFSGVEIVDVTLDDWADFGTLRNAFFSVTKVNLLSSAGSFKLINCIVNGSDLAGVLTGTILDISYTDPTYGFDVNLNVLSGFLVSAALVRIDPFIPDGVRILFNGVSTGSGSIAIFDTTGGSTGTYTVVTDNTTVDTIISVSNVSGDAEFTVSGGPSTPLLGSTVVHTGFSESKYNGTFTATSIGSSIYQVGTNGVSGASIAFEGDDSGTADMTGITIQSNAHGLSNGTSLTLNSDLSTEYDGGFVIYNVQTNTFDVADTVGVTQTGTWDTSGVDQTTPNVLAFSTVENASSHYIATAFVNDNSTANGTIINNTFTDLVFGTVGSALIEGTTIERWKLIDKLNGTFEYTGNEPFDGLITFDFTMVSSGGTVDFRHKWMHDIGAGFVDLPDNVESLTAVGSDARPVTKTFPLAAVKGDQIKPQITRNSGTSAITTTHATIYASQ